MKKMTAKQHNTLANILMGAGVVINLIDMMQNFKIVNPIPLIISIVLVAGGAVYSYLLVRCPHCGDKLKGCRNHFPERCPVCGKPLDKLPEDL